MRLRGPAPGSVARRPATARSRAWACSSAGGCQVGAIEFYTPHVAPVLADAQETLQAVLDADVATELLMAMVAAVRQVLACQLA